MGDEVTISMRVSKEARHLGVYSKGVSFFSRFMRGLAKRVKFGIKGVLITEDSNVTLRVGR